MKNIFTQYAVHVDLHYKLAVLQYVGLTLYHTIPTLNDPKKKPFENIVVKGENAGNQHFRLFTQYFLPISKSVSDFKLHLFCPLERLSIWSSLKICSIVKG